MTIHSRTRGSCDDRLIAYGYRRAEVIILRPVQCGQFGIELRSCLPTACRFGVHIDDIRLFWKIKRLLSDHNFLSTDRHASIWAAMFLSDAHRGIIYTDFSTVILTRNIDVSDP
jgi:hypothetical protein